MAKARDIRIYGQQRDDIDVDLMAQIVVMLGRQLAQDRLTNGSEPGNPPVPAAEGEEPA